MYENLDIITIGESLIEFSTNKSFAEADSFSKYYGGYALGVAISALRSGSKVGYITKVKNDAFGEFLLDSWQAEGLDSSRVKFSNYQNGISFIGKHNGKTEAEFYRKKTSASTLSVADIDFEYIKKTKFVFATGFVQSLSLNCKDTIRETFKFAKENDIMVGYYPDFNHTELLRDEAVEMFNEVKEYVDILFLDINADLIFDTKSIDQIIILLADMQLDNALIIKSDEALWAVNGTEVASVKVSDFIPYDLTGYSSAIIGAYISSILKGESKIEALRYANALGMIQASKIGAIKPIPSREETLETLRGLYE